MKKRAAKDKTVNKEVKEQVRMIEEMEYSEWQRKKG